MQNVYHKISFIIVNYFLLLKKIFVNVVIKKDQILKLLLNVHKLIILFKIVYYIII